jgi:energy-coupling factor transport system permease protein
LSSGLHLLLYAFFAALVFLSGNIQVHMAISASVASALFFLPLKKVRSGLVPILLFLSFTFVSNLLYQSGRVVAVVGTVAVTYEGLKIAAIRVLRVFDMVYAAKILVHITPLEEMIDSLRTVFSPLGRIGLPVHDFFSITTLTLQCFPVLKQKLYKLYIEAKLQTGTNSKSTVMMMASFMIPLFVESMVDPEKFFMTGIVSADKKENNG